MTSESYNAIKPKLLELGTKNYLALRGRRKDVRRVRKKHDKMYELPHKDEQKLFMTSQFIH